MTKENISLDLRLKKINERRNDLLEEIKLMNRLLNIVQFQRNR